MGETSESDADQEEEDGLATNKLIVGMGDKQLNGERALAERSWLEWSTIIHAAKSNAQMGISTSDNMEFQIWRPLRASAEEAPQPITMILAYENEAEVSFDLNVKNVKDGVDKTMTPWKRVLAYFDKGISSSAPAALWGVLLWEACLMLESAFDDTFLAGDGGQCCEPRDGEECHGYWGYRTVVAVTVLLVWLLF
ncbi:serine-rich repeat protein 2 [Corchorus capsularis]|uniref:Serine-rich repeat protein 2 n=1 Tax=Corchorus capsularis TaxID=210143 RepID=A0A1R3IJA7_COCAP|nr:serine-rich repeat protein 2 [Corchorus capsularis]